MKVYQCIVGLSMGNTESLPPIFPQKAKKNGEKAMQLSRNNMQIGRQ